MNRRFLPLLLVAILLASSIQPPAAAQAPQLRIPPEFRRVQASWIQEADRDLDRYIETHDLPNSTERQLRQVLNGTEQAYRDDRWTTVVRQLVSLRVFTVYAGLAQDAQDEDQPQQVYIDALDPRYSNVSVRSREVRGTINSTAEDVETVRGLESLYLSSQLLVQANQQLQQYPRFRSLAEASGNDTSESIYRTMVGTVVGARWNLRYAEDLVELSRQADNESRSPPIQASNTKLAWEEMEKAVESTPPEGQTATQTRESMNLTTQREEWVVSTALGERYITGSIRTSLGRQQQQQQLDADRLRQDLEDKATNLTLLIKMENAGFGAVALKDSLKSAYSVLEQGRQGNASLQAAIDSFAALQAQGTASQALLRVAEASTASDDAQPVDEGMSNLQAGFVGAALGALLGAGAVYVALEGRRRP